MVEVQSALPGARFAGYVTITEAGSQGMITLRGDLAAPQVAKAVRVATGVDVPGRRGIVTGDDGRGAAWMSPDELLLLMPRAGVSDALAGTLAALRGQHALVADVSDARAVFTLSGPRVREVLAKLCPADLSPDAFAPGEIRRTRAAQVPVAFWMSGVDLVTLVCFRSVAAYIFDILRLSAQPGGEVGLFDRP